MSTYLITGGTGKTGRRIVPRLVEKGAHFIVASRSGRMVDGYNSVRFDWTDKSTFEAALNQVTAIYLLAPTDTTDSLGAMQPFLDRALDSGVKRFVLLSASSISKDGPMMGAVHAYLETHATEWTVLRPTWFMQNFSEQQHMPTIRDEGCIYSATGEGRVAFIDAEDIANVAVEALTRRVSFNCDLILTGPEAISYDTVAETISQNIGRSVTHVILSEAELAERYMKLGMDEEYARTLSAMDTAIASGSEDRMTDEVVNAIGREPHTFNYFVKANRKAWLKN